MNKDYIPERTGKFKNIKCRHFGNIGCYFNGAGQCQYYSVCGCEALELINEYAEKMSEISTLETESEKLKDAIHTIYSEKMLTD